MALDISTARSDIAKVYIATFNRVPDSAGLDFWVSAYLNGSSLASIANGFASSAEYAAKYPSFLTNEEYVASIYTNVFGRKVDDDGRDFWVGALDAGTVTKAGLLNSLVAAANANGSTDGAKLTNEASFGVYCATNNIQWTNAAAALATITSDTATVTAAQTAANLAESTLTITSANAVLTAFTNTNITPSATYLTTTNNIITAGINLSGANITDASTTDSDTLTASLNGAGLTTAPTITNIETINFTTNATGATSLLGVTGATAINVSGGAANFSNYDGTNLHLVSGYASALTTAPTAAATAHTIYLDGTATGASITDTGATAATLKVTANSSLSGGLTAGAGTVTVTGAGNLTVGTLTTLTALNASTMTGALTANLTNAATVTVTGGSGNDVLTQAAAAAVSVNGGAGNDTFAFDITGTLTVSDTINGGDGTDTLTTSGYTTTTDLNAVTNVEVLNLTGSGVTYNYTTVDALVAMGQTLTVNGSALTTVLTWNGAAETNGVFSVTGGTGADSITGGANADTITGGNGADSITGGAGNDIISLTETTGAADKVIFSGVTSALNGADTITGFVVANDILDVGALNNANSSTTITLDTLTALATEATSIAVANTKTHVIGNVNNATSIDTAAKMVTALTDYGLLDAVDVAASSTAYLIVSGLDLTTTAYVYGVTMDGTAGMGSGDVVVLLGTITTDSTTFTTDNLA